MMTSSRRKERKDLVVVGRRQCCWFLVKQIIAPLIWLMPSDTIDAIRFVSSMPKLPLLPSMDCSNAFASNVAGETLIFLVISNTSNQLHKLFFLSFQEWYKRNKVLIPISSTYLSIYLY
jgi:hypothetical protein